MTDTTRIADKIARLLAKAEGTDNPHEAAAFADRAQALMVQHAIDQSMLTTDRDTRDEQIVTRSFRIGKKGGDANSAKHYLVNMIAGANGGYAYYTSGRGADTGVAHIVAHESDADLIVDITAAIMSQAVAGAVRYADEHRDDTEYHTPRDYFDRGGQRKIGVRKLKRSYLAGFCYGAAAKLDGMREKIVEAAGDSGALVLARDEAIARHQDALGVTTNSASTSGLNGDAYYSGKDAGTSSDVGAARIGGTRGALPA